MAEALSEKEIQEFQTLYELGREACERGEYASCHRLFEELDERLPWAPHKFYLAEALVGMGRLLDGIALWQELANTPAQGDADVAEFQEVARRRIAEVEPQVPRMLLELSPRHAPSELSVRLDGRLLSAAEKQRELRVDPGVHQLELAQAGFITEQREMRLGLGELERVPVALSSLDASEPVVHGRPAPASQPATPPAASERASSGGSASAAPSPVSAQEPQWLMPAGVTLTVLGAAAMVSGGVAWSLKESSREQLLDDCGGGDECHGLTSAEFRDRRSRVETRTTVSNVLLFGGGALLAGGLTLGVLHFAADRDDPTASGLSAGLSLDAGWVTYDAAF